MNQDKPVVMLVHGLWMCPNAMRYWGWHLRRHGYRVLYFNYASRRRELDDSVERLARRLENLPTTTLHLVGHSMGGLVILRLLEKYPDLPPGRVVTAGSPLKGSKVATELGLRPFWRWALGCARIPLATPPVQPTTREHGVIIGNSGWGLGHWLSPLPEPHDGVVSMAEALWPAATDTLTLAVGHSPMLVSRAVIDAVAGFLAEGRFGGGG